jgi:hypothetical protein
VSQEAITAISKNADEKLQEVIRFIVDELSLTPWDVTSTFNQVLFAFDCYLRISSQCHCAPYRG